MNIPNLKAFFSEVGKDSPVIGAGALSIAGVPLQTWVLILAVLYGVARLIALCLDVYWKWKDRHDKGK